MYPAVPYQPPTGPRLRSLAMMLRPMQEVPVLRRSGNARDATGTTTFVSFADSDTTRISTRRDSGLEVRLKEKFVCGTLHLRNCYHGKQRADGTHGTDLLSRPPGQVLLLQTGLWTHQPHPRRRTRRRTRITTVAVAGTMKAIGEGMMAEDVEGVVVESTLTTGTEEVCFVVPTL